MSEDNTENTFWAARQAGRRMRDEWNRLEEILDSAYSHNDALRESLRRHENTMQDFPVYEVQLLIEAARKAKTFNVNGAIDTVERWMKRAGVA